MTTSRARSRLRRRRSFGPGALTAPTVLDLLDAENRPQRQRPGDRVVQRFFAPEQLAVDDAVRRAEDAERRRALGVRAQARAQLRRFGAGEDRLRRLAELGRGSPRRRRAVDRAVLAEVRDVDAAHEVAAPRLVGDRARDARRDDRVARELRRPPPRQAELRAQALHVAPHVGAAARVEVEVRRLPALQREDRAEQERPPHEPHAGVRGTAPRSASPRRTSTCWRTRTRTPGWVGGHSGETSPAGRSTPA